MKLAIAVAALAVLAGCTSTSRITFTEPPPITATATHTTVVLPAGVVLPDPVRTPGATNPAVTQATIASTICVAGWTAAVRPPAAYTTALKARQLRTGYTLDGDANPRDYEEDHLIPLEVGGSPTSELNLWPQPYTGQGARVKDQVENTLRRLVCAGRVPLATAQRAIAADWWAAYQTYH